MDRHERAGMIRVSLADWIADSEQNDEPRHAISVVTARAGVGRATLLRYEEWGLLEPARSGRQRLYSESDIEQVLRVRRLTDDLGINLAGAAAVLHLRRQVIALQRDLQSMRERLDQ